MRKVCGTLASTYLEMRTARRRNLESTFEIWNMPGASGIPGEHEIVFHSPGISWEIGREMAFTGGRTSIPHEVSLGIAQGTCSG